MRCSFRWYIGRISSLRWYIAHRMPFSYVWRTFCDLFWSVCPTCGKVDSVLCFTIGDHRNCLPF